jgi:hypothetical protein
MVDAIGAAGGIGADKDAVGAQAYLDALAPILARVSRQADGPVRDAADLLVASLRAGGVVQAFGTGHSEALAMELAGRAGGLVPTNRPTSSATGTWSATRRSPTASTTWPGHRPPTSS